MRRYGSKAAAALGALAVIVFTVTIIHAVWYAPVAEVPVPIAAEQSVSPGEYPARLIIPAIGVSASVEKVGIVAGNRMAAPSNFSEVGWYKYGTVPGYAGSAVIAGHVDNGLGLAGVFKNLSRLQAGDEIDVTEASGTLLHFTVERTAVYPYQSVPSDIFTARDAARLNLITCEGTFIKTKALGWTVDHRLVVYAVLNQNPSH